MEEVVHDDGGVVAVSSSDGDDEADPIRLQVIQKPAATAVALLYNGANRLTGPLADELVE